MKKINFIILLTVIFISCQNTGDKNQSDVKVREADSAIKATSPNDAAGSSGRNDTAMTPAKITNAPGTNGASQTKTGTDSSGSANANKQPGDSTKRKQ